MPTEENKDYEIYFHINGKTFPVNITTNVVGTGSDEDWEDEEEEQDDKLTIIKESAKTLFEVYQSFKDAGFNDNHAFSLLKQMLIWGRHDTED